MSEEKDDTTFVYVICKVNAEGQFCSPCKIGISNSVEFRLAGLQTACPFKIDTPYYFQFPSRHIAREIERSFHMTQKRHQLQGEWFDLAPIEAIHLLCIATRVAVQVHVTDKSIIEPVLRCAGVYWAEKKYGLMVPEGTVLQ